MQTSNSQERRFYPRKELYSEVVATDPVGNVSTFLGVNYSKTGIAILSYEQMNLGDIFRLMFTVSDPSGTSQQKLNAKVVQHHNVGEIFVAGLRFQEELAL